MSYPVNDPETELMPVSNKEVDIKKFIFKLIGFLPWIILSVLLSYTIARLYLRYTPQIYKIAGYMLIKDEQENSSENRILEGLGVSPDSKEVQNQIDILESYDLASGIVDSLNLQVQIISQGRITSLSLYGNRMPVFIHRVANDTLRFKPSSYKLLLFDKKFSINDGSKSIFHNYNDTFTLAGKRVYIEKNYLVKSDADGYILNIRDAHDIAMSIKTRVNVQKMHDMGGILEVAISDEVPDRAKDIVNTLIKAYNTAGLTDKNVVGYKTLRFLDDRIDTISKELDDIEIETQLYKKNNKIEDISAAGSMYLTQSMNYDNLEKDQIGQLKLLESIGSYVQNSKSFTDIIPSEKGLTEPTLGRLIDEYNQAVLDYQNQLQISTDRDPVISRSKTNLTELKGNIIKNIESVKDGYNTKLQQIENTKGSADNMLASVPEKERELVKLKRQSGVKEQIYLYLLQKKEETQLSLASNINNTRVVDEAINKGVISPQASQIITFSYILGIIFPVVIMLLLDFFNNKIADKKEVEQGTKVPIVGELSLDKKISSAIISVKSRSVLAEQLRLVRTNLQYMGGGDPIKTILVTSFMSGEGKSFITINLAGSLASSGNKVLLLELDLRKPKFTKYLNIKPQYGLTDFVVNNKTLKEIITKVPGVENIDIITSGPIPPNPSELLMNKKIKELLEELKTKYDYIVIDSSPVGLVADAFSLDKLADVSLFILRHVYSYKTSIQYIDRLFIEKKFKNLGIIVNGITNVNGLGYNYGYGYGYSYGYGYHYGNGYYGDAENSAGLLGKLFSFFKRK